MQFVSKVSCIYDGRVIMDMLDCLVCAIGDTPLKGEGVSPSSFLSVKEQAICAGLHMEKRRQEWLLGRWTAKRLLTRQPRFAGLPFRTISVFNDPDGAPYLTVEGRRLPLCLSVSHRGHRAFCGLSETHTIGVDIERVEPRSPAFAETFYLDRECQQLSDAALPYQDRLVTVFWSVKESVLKVLREGLRMDTRQVEVQRVVGIEVPSGHDWQEIHVRCVWPDAPQITAWWRPDEKDVLTVAAMSSASTDPCKGEATFCVARTLARGTPSHSLNTAGK